MGEKTQEALKLQFDKPLSLVLLMVLTINRQEV